MDTSHHLGGTPAPFLHSGLAVLLALGGCGGAGSPAGSTPPGVASDPGSTGSALYAAHCAMCHGAGGEGSAMGLGPALTGIAERWDEARLREYLRDPRAYAEKDPRVVAERMPALSSGVSDDELGALARHALRLMDPAR